MRGRRGEVDGEGPSGIGGSREAWSVFPLPTWAWEACWVPRPAPRPSGAPFGHVGLKGMGEREEGGKRNTGGLWRGDPPGPEDQGRHNGHFPHPLGPREACWGLPPSRTPSSCLVLGAWSREDEKRQTGRGPFGSEDQQGACLELPLPTQAPGSLPGSQAWSSAL